MRNISIRANANGTAAVNARLDDALEYIRDEFNVDFTHSAVQDVRRKHHDGHRITEIRNDEVHLGIGIDRPPAQLRDSPHEIKHIFNHAEGGHLIHVRPDTLLIAEDICTLINAGVTIHVIDAGLRLDAGKSGGLSPTAERMIEALSEEDTDASEAVTGRKHTGGRPPLGMQAEDGMLRAADDYAKVRMTLHRVDTGEMTRADAARRLDCVPRTIDNALEKRDLYRLDAIGT